MNRKTFTQIRTQETNFVHMKRKKKDLCLLSSCWQPCSSRSSVLLLLRAKRSRMERLLLFCWAFLNLSKLLSQSGFESHKNSQGNQFMRSFSLWGETKKTPTLLPSLKSIVLQCCFVTFVKKMHSSSVNWLKDPLTLKLLRQSTEHLCGLLSKYGGRSAFAVVVVELL